MAHEAAFAPDHGVMSTGAGARTSLAAIASAVLGEVNVKTQVAEAENQLDEMGEMLQGFVQNIEENLQDLEQRTVETIKETTLENRDLEQHALGMVSRIGTENEKVTESACACRRYSR